jgi:hypothetical protein
VGQKNAELLGLKAQVADKESELCAAAAEADNARDAHDQAAAALAGAHRQVGSYLDPI